MDADRGSALRRRAVIGTKRATENVSFADAAVIGRPARFPANKTHTNHKYACHIWADPATLPAKVRHGARWGMLELQDMAGHLIRRLHQISVSVFTERMRDAGFDLTPVQFATLAALEAHPDVDQATLAGLIAHDRVTIGGAVDRMEAKGLISRRVSPQDRRARRVRLTDAGRSTLLTGASAGADLSARHPQRVDRGGKRPVHGLAAQDDRSWQHAKPCPVAAAQAALTRVSPAATRRWAGR